MPLDRLRLQPPRERTFAELFPWRNVGRALMLVLLIFAIIAIKRSTGPLLGRVSDLWGPPAVENQKPRASHQQRPDVNQGSSPEHGRRVRLGPGLAPQPSARTDGR